MLNWRWRARVLGLAALAAIALPDRAVAQPPAGESPRPASDRGAELRDAALAGDLARVKGLLDAGVPVDAAARHGQTALYFAAQKGHLAVVQLLLDRGADVNARDRFFGGTPLAQALDGKHAAVSLLLLEKGAVDAASALATAIEEDNFELARAALATGRVERLELLAARRSAEAKGTKRLVELLAAASPASREHARVATPPEQLSRYAGRYQLQGAGEARLEATVEVKDGALVLEIPGRAPLSLDAVAENAFETSDGNTGVRFGGRGGLVEWALVNEAGELRRLSAVVAEPQPLKVAATGPGVPGGTRTAPAPWPQFRGTAASGIADGQGAPVSWSVPKAQNVRFKTALPGLALSSPVVWGDRIFVTTAVSAKNDRTFRTGIYGDGTSVDDVSEHSFRVLALDRRTGAVVWEREAHRSAPTVRRHLKSSLANATPATDGRRVVVLFGPVGVLAAYDMEGRLSWKTDVGILDCNDPQSGTAEWGHASSPLIFEDLVIVQGDRRADSFLAAYRVADGSLAWRVGRDESSTWSTPNVLRAPSGDELITNGRTIRAYDPRTGRLLWTLGPNSEVVVASPVVGDGMAFLTAGYPPIRPVYAVRAGQRGDLTLPDGTSRSAAIAWSHPRGGTYIPSPILYRGHLYTINNNGILTCYRADTGDQVYQTRLGGAGASFAASPIAADGRLYFASETGEVYVLRAGPEFELLATNAMDEVVLATPAVSDGLLVVRTLGHVVGISEDPGTTR